MTARPPLAALAADLDRLAAACHGIGRRREGVRLENAARLLDRVCNRNAGVAETDPIWMEFLARREGRRSDAR